MGCQTGGEGGQADNPTGNKTESRPRIRDAGCNLRDTFFFSVNEGKKKILNRETTSSSNTYFKMN